MIIYYANVAQDHWIQTPIMPPSVRYKIPGTKIQSAEPCNGRSVSYQSKNSEQVVSLEFTGY